MRTVTAALPALVLVSACAHTLRIPQPAPGGPGDALPPLPPAVIAVPLTADVRTTLQGLDAEVPREVGTDGAFRPIGPFPVSVRYRVTRAPFRFEARDGVLRAETVLQLSAEACASNPLGIPLPLIGNVCQPIASCGVGEAPRRIVVATQTRVRLDPSWRVIAETVPEAPRVIDRCELTPFRVDVSGFVSNVVLQEVARATAQLDQQIALRGDLRPLGERVWAGLQASVPLADGFSLTLSPEAVLAAPLTLDETTVRTRVGVVARPAVVAGGARANAPRPLPMLTEAQSGGDGFALTLDAAVGFEEVTRIASQEFVGRTLDLDGHRVEVRSLRASGYGRALLFEVGVRFADGVFEGQQGTVHLVGVPAYDAARGELVVRDVDYTLESQSALVEVGEWFLRGGLRDAIAAHARIPLGERVARLRAGAQQALTRTLAQGTRMEGALGAVTPIGAFVTGGGVTVRVRVEGTARVVQDADALGLTGARRANE